MWVLLDALVAFLHPSGAKLALKGSIQNSSQSGAENYRIRSILKGSILHPTSKGQSLHHKANQFVP